MLTHNGIIELTCWIIWGFSLSVFSDALEKINRLALSECIAQDGPVSKEPIKIPQMKPNWLAELCTDICLSATGRAEESIQFRESSQKPNRGSLLDADALVTVGVAHQSPAMAHNDVYKSFYYSFADVETEAAEGVERERNILISFSPLRLDRKVDTEARAKTCVPLSKN